MMKFYHSTGTCSLAAHIILEELQIPYQPIEVSFRKDIHTKELDEVNPLGAVPVIVTDEGRVLSQNVAVLEFLGDLKPTSGVMPAAGSWERREVTSWLSLIASDLQKSYSPLFRLEMLTANESAQKEIEGFYKTQIKDTLRVIDQRLSGREYVAGSKFTVADAYLFTIVGWAKWVEINTKDLSNITSYMKRIFDRPAVQKVLQDEDALDYLQ